MAWLPATSTLVAPARSDMARCAGGGIIPSSVVTRYQLGFTRQAGSETETLSAATPHRTLESALEAARSAPTYAADVEAVGPREVVAFLPAGTVDDPAVDQDDAGGCWSCVQGDAPVLVRVRESGPRTLRPGRARCAPTTAGGP